MQNLVVASNKQSPLNPPGVLVTPKACFLTPPRTVEHPERHWHTGDTDVDESDSDESEREHPHDTEHPERHWHTGHTDVDESDSDESEREHPHDVELEGTDLSKTEKEKPEDTDVNESDSGNKDPYEDEDDDENHHITIIPRNDPQNPYKIRITYVVVLSQKHPQKSTVLKCSVMHAFCMNLKRNKYKF